MTTMKDAVHWVKDALSSKDVVQQMTNYLVQDCTIKATDGRLTACHPFPSDAEFLVAGEDFEKVLNRMPLPTPELDIVDAGVRLSAGRFRGVIQTMSIGDWTMPIPEAEWEPVPEGLFDGLRLLRPFVSTNAAKAWALCVCISNGKLYATNNVVGVVTEVSGTKGVEALIPNWAIDFLARRDSAPTHWQHTDRFIAFQWGMGGPWMRTQLVNDKFPESFAAIIDAATEPEFLLTPEWIEAFQRVASLSENEIQFHADKMKGGRAFSSVEEDAETPVPESGYSTWDPRYLGPVISIATHWQPDTWPKPSPFMGNSIRGLMAARNPTR